MNEKIGVEVDESISADLKAEALGQAKLDLEHARGGLAKLPVLGPAMWLYGRDPVRKFTFVADMDWLLLPPIVLDQFRLYTKNEVPVAFFTWAFVDDAIDARFRSGVSRLAPHEWKSGPHAWLIDMVSPFSDAGDALTELLKNSLAGHTVNALRPNPQQGGALAVHTWPAQTPASTHSK